MQADNGDKKPPIPFGFNFNGQKLTILEMDGVIYLIAKEVGHALGYGEGGSALATLITRDWKEELKEGQHWILLTGKRLAAVKDILSNTQGVDRTARLLLLTEPGLWRVLILTGKPAGIRLRDQLDSEILPQLRKTGRYDLGQTPPPPPLPPPPTPASADPEARRRPVAVKVLRGVLDALRGHGVEDGAWRALDAVLQQVESMHDLLTVLDDLPVEKVDANQRKLLGVVVAGRLGMLSSDDLQRMERWSRGRAPSRPDLMQSTELAKRTVEH